MAGALKVKIIKRSFIQSYTRNFVHLYNNFIVSWKDEMESVPVPVVGLDIDKLESGSTATPFKVILEDFPRGNGIDELIEALNTRETNRLEKCPIQYKEQQDRADNLDGYMWGVCISTADKIKQKERKQIKSLKSFENEVIGYIKGAGVLVC